MFLKIIAPFTTGLVFLLAPDSSMAQSLSDPLAPIVSCVQTGKFQVLRKDRLPISGATRTVDTLNGTRIVMAADGYRLILATSQGEPFANLKIELSAPTSVQADREAIIGQMQALSEKRTSDQKELQRTVVGGVEVLALHQASLERRGPLSFYSMLMPTKSLIAILYVLNQRVEVRSFSTYSEYVVLRDEVVNLVRTCLASE